MRIDLIEGGFCIIMVKDIKDSNFKESVVTGVVMVDFWAPWCAPCRMLSPILEEVQEEMQDSVQILKVNVDENPATANEYGIVSIPTILVFKDGNMVERITGMNSKENYKNTINKLVAE